MEFFKIFSFLWKGFQISLLTSPQPPQMLSLSQIMQENVILAYYAQIWKFGPRLPKMEFFKIFSFLWKGLQISLLMQPPPDIKFKSSYTRKRDFGLLCPNMEIRPQAPKNGIFKIFSFLGKGLQILLLRSPQPPADIKFKSSYARKHIIKKVESRTQLLKPSWEKPVLPSLKGSMNDSENEK